MYTAVVFETRNFLGPRCMMYHANYMFIVIIAELSYLLLMKLYLWSKLYCYKPHRYALIVILSNTFKISRLLHKSVNNSHCYDSVETGSVDIIVGY